MYETLFQHPSGAKDLHPASVPAPATPDPDSAHDSVFGSAFSLAPGPVPHSGFAAAFGPTPAPELRSAPGSGLAQTLAPSLIALLIFFVPLLCGQSARANDGSLRVTISEVVVQGGIDTLAGATEELIAPFHDRRSTVEELQILAEILELLYHEAGFFLARVTIPPQEVNDGDPFHLLVLDGHLEFVNLQGVPAPSRARLQSLLDPIVNRSFLTMAEFERILTLARQTPGLSVRTTLVPGEGTGASGLVVEGELKRFEGAIGLNRRFTVGEAPPGPGTSAGIPKDPWQASLQARFNQLFGRGEQLAIHASAPAASIFASPENRSVGVNIRWPLGASGTSLRLGYNDSPSYSPGPISPLFDTKNEMRHVSAEVSRPLRLSQTRELRLFALLEETYQSTDMVWFQQTVFEERARALRIGLDGRKDLPTGTRVSWSARMSAGMPLATPISPPPFHKLDWNASWRWPFTAGYTLTSTLRAQHALNGPLPEGESFSPAAGNGLPSLALAVGTGDHGWSVRQELDTRLSMFRDKLQLTVYGFVAAGGTAYYGMSPASFASAVGAGLRGDVGAFNWSLEYARGHSEVLSDSRVVIGLEVSF